jgi:hypothetical protein
MEEVDDVANRIQRELLLVSSLSGKFSNDGTWLVDRGALFHMIGVQELFKSFTEFDLDMFMELGMGTRHEVHGYGIV